MLEICQPDSAHLNTHTSRISLALAKKPVKVTAQHCLAASLCPVSMVTVAKASGVESDLLDIKQA